MVEYGTVNALLLALVLASAPPPPAAADIPLVRAAELLTDRFNKRLVRIEGTITDAGPDEIDPRWTHLVLESEGTAIYIALQKRIGADALAPYIGAQVSVVGRCALRSRGLRLVKGTFYLKSLDDITVLQPPVRPGEPPAVDILDYEAPVHEKHRNPVRVSAVGTVIAAWNGPKVLVRTDDEHIVLGELANGALPPCGRRIRLVGRPETDLYAVILTRATWLEEAGDPLPEPDPVPVSSLQLRRNEAEAAHYDFALHGRKVRLTGTVRSIPAGDWDGRLYLESDGRMVTADVSSAPDAVAGLDIGSRIEITGTCVMETEKMGVNRLFPRITGYRIVICRPDGIRVLARPPWWTPMKLLIVIGSLVLLLSAFFVWIVTLRKVAERRSRALLKEQLARAKSELKVGERTRLAVELHDALSQSLAGATLEVNTAEQLMHEDPDAAFRHLGIASRTLKSCRDELRDCLWDLRSKALEAADMNAAILRTLEPYVGDTVLSVRFNVPRRFLSDNTAHALMRIIRELVLNAIRHGRARTVRIAGSREDGLLRFSVRDDGCGFDPETTPGIAQGHFGLQGVRERIRMMKGRISIESSPGGGTRVSASISLSDEWREGNHGENQGTDRR